MENKAKSGTDVPADIIILVMSCLPGDDLFRFTLTCKPIRSIYMTSPIFSPSPRLNYKRNHFYQPIHDIVRQIDNFNSESENEENVITVCSTYGWLLNTRDLWCIFFRNPVTGEKVDIRKPPMPFTLYYFTAPPTTNRCTIYGITHNLDTNQMAVGIFRYGRKKWIVHEFPFTRCFSLAACSPLLHKNVLYCLGRRGNFFTFDTKTGKGCFTGCRRCIVRKLEAMPIRSYLVENDGELLVVFMARNGRWVGVYQLNVENMALERIYTLGKKILYVSNQGCFSETAVVSGTENRIYLPMLHEKKGLFYSLDTNKFHTVDGYSTNNLYVDKIYHSQSSWIKPVYYKISNNKLNW